jgi:cytochrome c peroxidase
MSNNYLSKILGLFLLIILAGCGRDEESVTGVDLTHISFDPVAYTPEIPVNLPPIPPTPSNPMTLEGIELGRFLFYDPILSRDSTISCGSCHRQELAFTDGLAKSIGIDGRVGKRSAMSLVNLAWADNGLFWDGRVKTLEQQSLHPIEDPLEMDETLPNVIKKLRQHPDYQVKFRKAFGITNSSEINEDLLSKALAQFQRSIISADSKYDRALILQTDFLTRDELDGYLMMFVEEDQFFQDAECLHCHNLGLFTDNSYRHNGLVPENEMDANPGRYLVTNVITDKGKFRVPTLRNIAVTAPYMHDGRLETLEDVIRHYLSGGHPTFNRDFLLQDLQSTSFSEAEIQKMLAFLQTLTDHNLLSDPKWSDPFTD